MAKDTFSFLKAAEAHVVASRRQLPKESNRWGLADNKGWTVAHEAALTSGIQPTMKAKLAPNWQRQMDSCRKRSKKVSSKRTFIRPVKIAILKK
jgi:hypothetical protein